MPLRALGFWLVSFNYRVLLEAESGIEPLYTALQAALHAIDMRLYKH